MDREFLDLDNPRNIRFGLSTDGMNPFGEWGSSHSTWPVIRRVGQQSQYMACDPMYVQHSFLAMHEAEVHDDAGAYPWPETTWQ